MRSTKTLWTLARHAMLGVGLVIALLQYYLIDIYVQIATMPGVHFLNPGELPAMKTSAAGILRVLS